MLNLDTTTYSKLKIHIEIKSVYQKRMFFIEHLYFNPKFENILFVFKIVLLIFY